MSNVPTDVREYDAITKTVQHYIDGAKSGSGDDMKAAFHDEATFFGNVGTDVFGGPIRELFNWNDENGPERPVHVVHNDYTERSGPQRVRDLLDADDAETFLQHRFAVVNLWRSIGAPVETTPIALAGAQSIAPEDFIATDLIFPDRTGEIYQVAYSPNHRWFYFPQMRRDEALLLKVYDSATDGPARFTAHTAFDDPTAPDNAAPRESIEVRTLISFAP